MTTHKVVFGAFKTPAGAQSAVHTLESHGFLHRDISVLMTESARQHFATVQKNTKGPEGAAVGGVAGGIIGAIAAGLTAVVTVAVPGIGLLAAGPLVAVLAGLSAGAATGGLLGGLIGLGLSEHEAKLYEATIRGGGVVVAVDTRTSDETQRARNVLEEAGALKVNSERGKPADVSPPAYNY
ncbi:MAG: DUF3341 domain-containing protein [Myxococcales bacterium]|nr:DUF3341 domain-containing protein [Myxococcales bacterium]